VGAAFLEAYARDHPADTIVTLDLFARDLPTFEGAAVRGKYAIMHGDSLSADESEAWSRVEDMIAEFTRANKFVFAIPMWNFGVPYRLKQYLDLIVQPGRTFAFDPATGYRGLMKGKPVLAIYARGGTYEPGSPSASMDFQKPYMEAIFRFIGLADPQSIIVEPTIHGGPEGARDATDVAIKSARRLAAQF